MGNQSKTKDNFVVQAGILAAAGILSRIIGLLYKSPLVAVIGETGFGYYHAAYGFYTIVLLISSYSIPSAISKLIAPKLAVREYRNAHRLFYCALGYVLVVGMIAGLFLFFCAGWFVEEQAVPVLRMFAPTIFFYGILGVLRGYFQAHRSMVQTSFSQILEQIANAIVSIGGAWLLIKWGAAGVTADADMEGKRAVLGAMGSALGTGMGVLAGLIFMWGVYLLNRKIILRRVQRDPHESMDSYGSMIRMISRIVTPFILSTAIYNLNSTVVSYLYTKLIPNLRALDSDLHYTNYGTYGVAVTVFNIPIAFATAMASAMIPSVAQASASGDIEKTKEKITSAVKTTMIISIPAAVGLFVLAKPIIYILFPRSDEVVTLAAKLLMVLAAAVVLYALSTLSNSILQGLGRVNIPVVNAGIALTIQSIASFALLMYTDVDLYGLAITNTLYAAIMCVLNQVALRRVINYRQEWKKSFVLPGLASLVMGVSAKGAYQLLVLATRSPRIALVPAVAFGVIVYFVVLLSLKALSEEELKDLPKGHVLVKIAKKCKLL
ncbi:MAG: polysaccharide biosynthesis protein [Lachnospiraceae bacterium]|nr:polysaccharide biosynthesis protein [Lachnospiraceae bacterium]